MRQTTYFYVKKIFFSYFIKIKLTHLLQMWCKKLNLDNIFLLVVVFMIAHLLSPNVANIFANLWHLKFCEFSFIDSVEIESLHAVDV